MIHLQRHNDKENAHLSDGLTYGLSERKEKWFHGGATAQMLKLF